MRKLVSFLLILAPYLAFSGTISVQGNASFFKNEMLQVFKYDNLLANQNQLIASTKIPENGAYSITFEIDHPQFILIKIEMRELAIPVHPGAKLNLNFLPFKNASNQRIPLKYTVTYSEIPSNIAPDSVYRDLKISFAFIQNEVSMDTKLTDFYQSFFNHTDSLYSTYLISDKLFSDYYRYFKANAMLQTEYPKTKLIQNELLNQPIGYENKEYLNFFKACMNPRIHHLISKYTKEFERSVEEYQVYHSLLNFLQLDTNLGSTEMRSLALFIYTKGTSSQKYLSSNLKAAIINQMGNFCSFKTQKLAALHYQSLSNRLQKNMEAPIFELQNANNETVSLQDFRGKPVYLGFIHSKSTTCEKDLLIIDKLRKKYRKVKFVMVVSDRDSVVFSQLPNEASNLKFLYLNKNYSVLEKYQIWSYPIYYLIDKHGYFIQTPAKMPNDIFETFAAMFAPKSTRKRYEIIKP
tara:strand:+ start:48675 stop:50069 length:1395 start_codon:yes stop_codon:yes gene_type:complete